MNEIGQKKIIPQHVAIIMDGKRRWAQERNLSVNEGQQKGYEKMKQSFDWFFLRGVKYISFYLFPINFWQRDEKEVEDLLKLLKQVIFEGLEDFKNKDYRIIFSGRTNEIVADMQEFCEEVEKRTEKNESGTVNICLNYSGRAEIMDAIKNIIRNNLTEEQIHEGIIKKYLYNANLPDPDLIFRTGGKCKLSDFMNWQTSNSELMFLKKYWPDFEELDVVGIIEDYNKRLSL